MATSEKVGSDEDDSIRLRKWRPFHGELIRKNALFLYKREQQAEHGDIFLSNSIAINNYYTEHTRKKMTGPLVSGLRTFGKWFGIQELERDAGGALPISNARKKVAIVSNEPNHVATAGEPIWNKF